MEDLGLPVCFPVPDNPQAPPPPPKVKHSLHGADDLITLFDLKPLWERSVKPFTASSRTKQREQINASKSEAAKEAVGRGADSTSQQDGGGADKDEAEAGRWSPPVNYNKPLVMEKTYVNYVRDLPGKVRPPKRTISKYNTALAAAGSSGGPMPTLPLEVTGRTTMRDIVFRPETTVQRIAPFDDDSLRTAFTVDAGPIADIDLTLLESDDVDKQSPNKKKKKRKHQRDGATGDKSDEKAAKRAKLNAVSRR